ncbi:MAG: hypothetical protein LBC19_05615 [Tannerella sp.]|nr:hypothetical protein [Tannerella sp.]
MDYPHDSLIEPERRSRGCRGIQGGNKYGRAINSNEIRSRYQLKLNTVALSAQTKETGSGDAQAPNTNRC